MLFRDELTHWTHTKNLLCLQQSSSLSGPCCLDSEMQNPEIRSRVRLPVLPFLGSKKKRDCSTKDTLAIGVMSLCEAWTKQANFRNSSHVSVKSDKSRMLIQTLSCKHFNYNKKCINSWSSKIKRNVSKNRMKKKMQLNKSTDISKWKRCLNTSSVQRQNRQI